MTSNASSTLPASDTSFEDDSRSHSSGQENAGSILKHPFIFGFEIQGFHRNTPYWTERFRISVTHSLD